MNVQDLIDKLMLVKDKKKNIRLTVTTGTCGWYTSEDVDQVIENGDYWDEIEISGHETGLG